jgi:hypothetical protein
LLTKTLIYVHVADRFAVVQRRDLLILAVLYLAFCAFYFFSALAVTAPGYALDDAWIHQVFARNIATGHGFSYNPDIPVSGATAPLWTLFMALLWPISGPIAGGILAGVILEFLAIIAVYKLTIFITGQRGLAFLVSLLSILTWVLIWGALSGMEVGLYSALSLWGLYFYFKAQSFEDKYNYLAYGFFALAFLSRPECSLFLAAAAVRDMIMWLKSEHRTIAPWLWRIAIPAVLLAPYFAFNYSVTGSLLTQTFTAKEQGRGLLSGIIDGELKRIARAILIYPYYHLLDFFWNLYYLIPLLLPAFAVGTIKFATFEDAFRSKRIMMVILLILYTPLMGAFAPVLATSYHHMRTVDNIIPLFIMLGVAGLFWKTPSIGKSYIKILLWLALILSVVGTIFIFADDFIVRSLNSYLLQNISRFRDAIEYNKLTWYVRYTGKGTLFLVMTILIGIFLCLDWVRRKIALRSVGAILVVLMVGYNLVDLLNNAGIYANDVKNINDMDVKLGLYLKDIVGKNQKVAVNDIGAIGYFSGATILDLEGLISPEITLPMILNDSLAFQYMMAHDRVDYVAIFPVWFKYIPKRTDILKPIKRLGVDWKSIIGGDTTIVYQAEWPDSNVSNQIAGRPSHN